MINIREYRATDKQGVIELWNASFGEQTGHNEPGSVIDAKVGHADNLFFLAEENHQIIGTVMAGYDGHRGWLYSVAVHPENQRQGIGSVLVKHALEQLRMVGCIKVNLQIREGNEAVEGFYRRLGFDVEPRVSMGRLLR